jgi:hypothetical protein
MIRRFRKFRDDRFALTTLQNPTIELRTHAQLVAAAEREREILRQAAAPSQTPPLVSAPAVIEAIPPPSPSAPPDPPQDSVTANAAPPPERKRKPRPRKKSTPHRHAKLRQYAKRRRQSAPVSAQRPEALDSPRGTLFSVAGMLDEVLDEVPDQGIRPELVPEYDDPNLPELERHARKCVICRHPDRVGIEADFLNWRNTDLISHLYHLNDFRPIYRHARATGLFQQRRANLRFAAELIIEHADTVVPTAEGVLRAIRASARINDDGQWIEPPSHVIVSTGGRVTAPQYGPLPQISMTQEVLPAPIPPPATAQPINVQLAPAQPSIARPEALQFDFVPVELAQLEVPPAELAPSQPPSSQTAATPQPGSANHAAGTHQNLIGHTAIRNRRKILKTNGEPQF